jgi:hypothetical protein
MKLKKIIILSLIIAVSSQLGFNASKISDEKSKENNSFIVVPLLVSLLALFLGILVGFCITKKHLFEAQFYPKHKKCITKLMINDIENIKKCINHNAKAEQLTRDLNNVSYQLYKLLKDDDKLVLSNKLKENKKEVSPKCELQNCQPLSVTTFGVGSIISIDNSLSSDFPIKKNLNNNNNNNSSSNSSKHSRYLNKNTDCYTIQNNYCNMKDIESSAIFCNRTSSTSSNNSSNTSGILTSFTNSDTCLFQNDETGGLQNINNDYYVEINLTDTGSNSYFTNMLQNYPKKSMINNKLFDYQNKNTKSNSSIYDNTEPVSQNITTQSPGNENDYINNKQNKRQFNLLQSLLKTPSKNSYV